MSFCFFLGGAVHHSYTGEAIPQSFSFCSSSVAAVALMLGTMETHQPSFIHTVWLTFIKHLGGKYLHSGTSISSNQSQHERSICKNLKPGLNQRLCRITIKFLAEILRLPCDLLSTRESKRKSMVCRFLCYYFLT